MESTFALSCHVDTGHAGSRTSVEEGIRRQELMLHFVYRVLG